MLVAAVCDSGSQGAFATDMDTTVANKDVDLLYRGTWATAGDMRFPGGRVSDTGYHVTSHEVVNAWRTPGGFVAVDVSEVQTS